MQSRRTAGLFLTSVFPSIEVTFDKSPRLNVVHGVVQGMIIREQIRIVLKHVRNNIRHRGRIAYPDNGIAKMPLCIAPRLSRTSSTFQKCSDHDNPQCLREGTGFPFHPVKPCTASHDHPLTCLECPPTLRLHE